jgi:hypothetical protein
MDDNKKININPAMREQLDAARRLLDSDPELNEAFELFKFKQDISIILERCVKYQDIIVALNKVDALKTHPQVMVEYANKGEEANAEFHKRVEEAHDSGVLDDKHYEELNTMYRVFQLGIMLIKLFDNKKESDDGSEDKDQN